MHVFLHIYIAIILHYLTFLKQHIIYIDTQHHMVSLFLDILAFLDARTRHITSYLHPRRRIAKSCDVQVTAVNRHRYYERHPRKIGDIPCRETRPTVGARGPAWCTGQRCWGFLDDRIWLQESILERVDLQSITDQLRWFPRVCCCKPSGWLEKLEYRD